MLVNSNYRGEVEVVLGETVHEAALADARVSQHQKLHLLTGLYPAIPLSKAPLVSTAASCRQETLYARTGQPFNGQPSIINRRSSAADNRSSWHHTAKWKMRGGVEIGGGGLIKN